MERRIVAQLLTSLDDLATAETDGKPIIIIGATNRPGEALVVHKGMLFVLIPSL